jgi:hypothetical protein
MKDTMECKNIPTLPSNISKRDYFAAMAMFALMSTSKDAEFLQSPSSIAEDSWKLADALLSTERIEEMRKKADRYVKRMSTITNKKKLINT